MHLRDLQDRAADSVAELLLLSGANPLILGRQTVLMRLLSSQAMAGPDNNAKLSQDRATDRVTGSKHNTSSPC